MLKYKEFEIGDVVEVSPHFTFSHKLVPRGLYTVAAVRTDDYGRFYGLKIEGELEWMDAFYCSKPQEKICHCGAKSVGSEHHSSWC
jgi:hypothetical protein